MEEVDIDFTVVQLIAGCWEHQLRRIGQELARCEIGMCIPSGNLRTWLVLFRLWELMVLTF